MPAAPNGAGGGQGCGAYGRSIARVGGKVSGWGALPIDTKINHAFKN